MCRGSHILLTFISTTWFSSAQNQIIITIHHHQQQQQQQHHCDSQPCCDSLSKVLHLSWSAVAQTASMRSKFNKLQSLINPPYPWATSNFNCLQHDHGNKCMAVFSGAHSYNVSECTLLQNIQKYGLARSCGRWPPHTQLRPTCPTGCTGPVWATYLMLMLISFIEAKDDGGGAENWSNKNSSQIKSSPPTNEHLMFYRQYALPVAQP